MFGFVDNFVAFGLVALAAVFVVARHKSAVRHLGRTFKAFHKKTLVNSREFEHFRMAAEHADDGILVQEMNGTVLWVNPAYCRIMGLSKHDILGRNPLEFAMPPDLQPSNEDIVSFRYDPSDPELQKLQLFRNRRSDGQEFWNQISVSIQQANDGQPLAVLVCRDVTAQIKDEERLREVRDRLEHAASHDMLTGVANRSELFRFSTDALTPPSVEGQAIGMIHIDVDKFKEINDTHGHFAGDRTLRHVADSIKKEIRHTDLVSRLGGDEFVIVCTGLEDLKALSTIGRNLRRAIKEPFEWNGMTMTCSASMGASLSMPSDVSPNDLMARSDYALYEAKRLGRDRLVLYDERLHYRHVEQQKMSAQLREVVAQGGLSHAFQPTFDMKSGSLIGVETLVRWVRPDGTILPPDEFLPLADELGLLGALDLGSMTAGLDMKERLDTSGFSDLSISFNASNSLLTHPDFLPLLIRGVDARGIDRSQVNVEVLETNIFGETDAVIRSSDTIADLRDAGFRVFLDNFGTGHAGLGHLTKLDITGVKIDRSLVRDVLSDTTNTKIVSTITSLCRDLDLEVIAEGVENATVAAKLSEFGCDVVQGYWISKAVSSEELFELVAQGVPQLEPIRTAI